MTDQPATSKTYLVRTSDGRRVLKSAATLRLSDSVLEEIVPTEVDPILAALRVLVMTPHIRRYLMDTDPKALAQAVQALTNATTEGGAA